MDQFGKLSCDDMWAAIFSPEAEEHMMDPVPESRDWFQVGDHPTGRTAFAHKHEWGYPTHWHRGDAWNFFMCLVFEPHEIENNGGIQ